MNAGEKGEKGMEDEEKGEGKWWKNWQRRRMESKEKRGMGMECRVRERKLMMKEKEFGQKSEGGGS